MKATRNISIVDEPKPLVGTAVPEVITTSTKDDGAWVIAEVRIPPEIARRIKGRAYHQDLGEYLNENIIKRAIEGAVY